MDTGGRHGRRRRDRQSNATTPAQNNDPSGSSSGVGPDTIVAGRSSVAMGREAVIPVVASAVAEEDVYGLNAPALSNLRSGAFFRDHRHEGLRSVFYRILRANSSMFLFTICHSLVWFLVMSGYAYYALNAKKATFYSMQWRACVFRNFDGDKPYSWVEHCGYRPTHRPPFTLTFLSYLAAAGYGSWATLPHIIVLFNKLREKLSKKIRSRFGI